MDYCVGHNRAYFHRRFVIAARTIIERYPGMIQKGQRPPMAVRMSIQDAVSRLGYCPVCGEHLRWNEDYPHERFCDCGEFVITAMWTSGDAVFEFTMTAEKPQTEIIEPADDVSSDDGT